MSNIVALDAAVAAYCLEHWQHGHAPLPVAPPAAPAVSIVTPVLNRRDWIERAVGSATCRTPDAVEHVVVDGGSTDGTLDVLTRYPHVRLVEAPGSSSNEAMNIGIAAARAPVLGFLSSDDAYAPGTLDAVLAHVGEAGEGFSIGACRAFMIEGAGVSEIVHSWSPPAQLVELLFGTPGFNAWFFRRDLFARFGHFDPAVDAAADRDFMLRLHAAGVYARAIPDGAYLYTRHSGSRTLDPAAALAERMLADHVVIARHFLRVETVGAEVRDWHAWELYRLARLRAVRGAAIAAIAAALRGLMTDPLWPLRVCRARAYERRLADAARKDQRPPVASRIAPLT